MITAFMIATIIIIIIHQPSYQYLQHGGKDQQHLITTEIHSTVPAVNNSMHLLVNSIKFALHVEQITDTFPLEC